MAKVSIINVGIKQLDFIKKELLKEMRKLKYLII